ncbi:MAG: pyruvate kinase, partial [Leptospiraceae bacterium]|nr:pyruvate kinase [Leptospiraceae bacterium]
MNAVKYTKIIATLGPASANAESIRTLIRAGSDCFRLNFSHGSGVTMDPLVDLVRQVSREEGVYIPILADIQGPKLRVGRLPEEGVSLKDGTGFILTTREIMGSADEVHSPYEYLTRDLKTGARVLLADGTIELKVERVEKQDVHCRVVHGGRLFSNKGINLPGTHVSVDTLTEKDRKDLEY